MKEVYEYLKNAGTFYLATNEDGQPRVRPFGAVSIFEDKLYLITGNQKNVYQQLKKNPKAEISGMVGGTWIRLACELEEDDRREAKVQMLKENEGLSRMYDPDDGVMAVFFVKNATAVISSFAEAPKTITF